MKRLRRSAGLFFLLVVAGLTSEPTASLHTEAPEGRVPAREQAGGPRSAFPPQLEVRAASAPTGFHSGGRFHLVYELYLTNYSPDYVPLRSIDVLDADNADGPTLGSFRGERLDDILRAFGLGSDQPSRIAPGASVIAFVWISVDGESRVPRRLRHRISTSGLAIEGAAMETHVAEARVLSSPLRGSGWTASDAPSNDPDNHHRRGVFVVGGQVLNSRRYAIDFMRYRDGKSVAYGEPVFAVANAKVAYVRDGLPDNQPAPVETFRPVVPVTMDNLGGNVIALDLGGGQFAWYAHLRPGSISVNAGDAVRLGQRLAEIGVSGDSNVPHLHFEVSTSAGPLILAGEGLPYVIDRYRAADSAGTSRPHERELPLDDMVVDFGDHDAK